MPVERHELWPLVEGSELAGVCIVDPEPALGSVSVPDDDDDAVVLLELVPVAASEASYVGSEGWAAFVELAERRGADLHDLRRPALVDGAA